MESLENDQKIKLQELSDKDAEDYFRLMDENRDHFSNFNNRHKGKYKSVKDAYEALSSNKMQRWGIYNPQAELIGTINLKDVLEDTTSKEVGYLVAEKETGKGYATDAIRQVIKLASGQKLEKLTARTHPENLGSQSVLEKAGFTKMGISKSGSIVFSLELS